MFAATVVFHTDTKMGVDCDANLVYGYIVEFVQVQRWLVSQGAKSCLNYVDDDDYDDEDYTVCSCGNDSCWKIPNHPKWLDIAASTPYFDCASENAVWTVGFTVGSKLQDWISAGYNDPAMQTRLKETVLEITGEKKVVPPSIMALPNIW